MSIFKKIQHKVIDYTFNRFAIPVYQQERISKQYIKTFLPVNPISIDCGAHTGLDSIEISKIIGKKISILDFRKQATFL